MEPFDISIKCSAESEAEELKEQLEKCSGFRFAIHRVGNEYVCEGDAAHGPILHKEDLYRNLSREIARFIIDHKENALLKRMISSEYRDYDAFEAERIFQYCLQYLDEIDKHQAAQERRHGKAADAIAACLQETGGDLHLDGALRFRLRSYTDELRDIVEYAVDEFIMDKQYEEFIGLLKYFVYVQEARVPAVHLIHRGNYGFIMLDEQMTPMKPKQMEGFVLERIDQDLNYEDMIVSTLITVSPAKLYVHTRDEHSQVIRTIMQIFADRASLCLTCPECASFLDETGRSPVKTDAALSDPIRT